MHNLQRVMRMLNPWDVYTDAALYCDAFSAVNSARQTRALVPEITFPRCRTIRAAAEVVVQQQHSSRSYPPFTITTSPRPSLTVVASTIAQQRSVPAAVQQHVRTDEDFINRSLLDQIDTDADTDPVFSSDSETTGTNKTVGGASGRNFGSSSSQSSVDSSGVSFPYQMQLHQQPPPRSDSPGSQRPSLAYVPRGGDQFMHTPQQSLYNNPSSEPSTDFSPFSDSDTQPSTASFDNTAFRNNSMFGSFLPPRTRPSVGGPPSAGFSHDTNAMNYNQYNTLSAADVFGAHQSLAQLPQQQQSAASRGYDFLSEAQGTKPNGKSVFANMDPFNVNPGGGSAMMQGHQMNKPPQNQVQQQQHLHNFANQPFANGLLQAQQPQHQANYGPHVPTNHSASLAGSSVSHANGLSNVSVTTQQEEISTIFVVGFPDDMQEREFQNMFTFSSGFEAATLKIPNKDSTAYGSSAPSNAGRGPYQSGYSYSGASDSYVQGDGTAWPPVDPNDVTGGSNINPGNQQGANPQPRKQIIGFAKFRTRSEALSARDLLQGRRIDIEKGAVLKAEMAKKNLHTKRGVGPLGPPLSVNVGPSGGNVGNVMPSTMGVPHGGGLGSIPENITAMTGMLSPGAAPASEVLTARERELGTLGAMGLGGLTRRDRLESQDDDRDNRRRRDFGSVNSLANNLSALNIQTTRGARERLEEDERERRRKEKEVERNRLRAGNQAAFDAFHSAANTQRNPLLSGLASPSETPNALPFSASLFSPQESIGGHNMDGWPGPTATNTQRLANMGSSGVGGMSAARPVPLGIATNLGGTRPTPSQETSPTEPTAGPASVSSRSGASDHGASQETELFSPTPAMSLSSHPSMSSLSPHSRPYSPTGDAPVGSSAILPSLPEQQHQRQVPANQGQGFPPASASSTSSVSGSRSSASSAEEDVSRTIGNIDVNSQQGAMSPQLPSPNSVSSSGPASRGNPSDQNPPINTLYVGNLPTSPVPGNQPNLLEDSLRSLFSRCPGYRKLCFRQKSNGPMCFVEFEDVSYATKALSDLYGHTLNGLVKGGIRLSYSKNPLGVRTPTNTANGNGLQQSLQSFGAGSGPFSSIQDAFSRHSAAGVLSIDMNAVRGTRRDASEVTSPSQYFTSSPPPPRFFSPPPSSGFNFTGQTSAPGLARSNNSSFASTFSPFGPSTPPETTPQAVTSEPTIEPVKSTDEPSNTPGLDSMRSG